MNLANCIYKSLADAIIRNSDLAPQTTPSAVAAASGHCGTSSHSLNHFMTIKRWNAPGNAISDEFSAFPMLENENHSHRTPHGLIPQSPSDYRGFRTAANLEAQGEVA
jgi:hypothetical protein